MTAAVVADEAERDRVLEIEGVCGGRGRSGRTIVALGMDAWMRSR